MRRWHHRWRVIVWSAVILAAAGPAFCDERVLIGKIVEQPSEYLAHTITVTGRITQTVRVAPGRGGGRCGTMSDTQVFLLEDESGSIEVEATGTCQPDAPKPLVKGDRVLVRGIVLTHRKGDKDIPVIDSISIDHLKP